MTHWNIADARRVYSVPHWSEGYFDVNDDGFVCVQPKRDGSQAIQLSDVVTKAQQQSLRLPLLMRFQDVLEDRVQRMQAVFAEAMSEHDYGGGYTAVYPIKVNQNRDVVAKMVASADEGLGLEAGSKPELMAVLAMAKPGSVVICNGYKDREYICLALIGRQLGLDVVIVIEKPSEVALVVDEAKRLNVTPKLGVRLRLASIGAGKWQNTGGDKAKFGLSAAQLMGVVAQCQQAGLAEHINLIHFHMGSQISNLRDIANGLREAIRYFVELSNMGLSIHYLDVGGGLGVDYEGTRSRSFCSMNYGLAQYASTIVQAVSEACQQHNLHAPMLITEAGRAMTAHHAVLVANVSEVEQAPQGRISPVTDDEPAALRHLRALLDELDERPALELYLEAQHHLAEGQDLFALGGMSLTQRGHLDDLFYALAHQVRSRLDPAERSHRDALDALNNKLVDKYFVNFSLFQSMPDIWAIDQVFPIMPIEGLNKRPDRTTVLADLTCDSDGRIDEYVDSEGLDSSLPLHSVDPQQGYMLGFFMVGAYQETLGDIHNLFGDTDVVNVINTDDGFDIISQQQGDTIQQVLGYVGYASDALEQQFKHRLAHSGLSEENQQSIQQALAQGLRASTYLEDQYLG